VTQGIGTIGWNIFGGLARQQSIVVKGDKVLNLHKKSRAWTGYFDIGYSLTPIFSSSTTATVFRAISWNNYLSIGTRAAGVFSQIHESGHWREKTKYSLFECWLYF